MLPPVTDILRGSLVERYVTCGNPACKCARGERHGPIWYLTVTSGRGRTTGGIISGEHLDQVRSGIENYHQLTRLPGKPLRDQSRIVAADVRALVHDSLPGCNERRHRIAQTPVRAWYFNRYYPIGFLPQ